MSTTIGPLHVRRSAFIVAPPARVWQEFQSFERIRGWLDRGHRLHDFEPAVGGRVRFSVEIDGEPWYFGGTVRVVTEAAELTFDSNWEAPHSDPVATLWTIRLTPAYEGTLVEILHHGMERFGAAAGTTLEGYEQGWDVKHLAALRAIVEQDGG